MAESFPSGTNRFGTHERGVDRVKTGPMAAHFCSPRPHGARKLNGTLGWSAVGLRVNESRPAGTRRAESTMHAPIRIIQRLLCSPRGALAPFAALLAGCSTD